MVSSRDDLEIQVRDQFNNVDSNLFNNNQIINAFNNTWNKIETKKSRIKEKIDIKIREILLYNNDSINSQDNLSSKIKDEFNNADRTLIENSDIHEYLNTNSRKYWHQFNEQRKTKLEEKIVGINGRLMLYEYCTSKDEFEQEIKNNFFNDNERKNIEKFGLEMIFTNKINSN